LRFSPTCSIIYLWCGKLFQDYDSHHYPGTFIFVIVLINPPHPQHHHPTPLPWALPLPQLHCTYIHHCCYHHSPSQHCLQARPGAACVISHTPLSPPSPRPQPQPSLSATISIVTTTFKFLRSLRDIYMHYAGNVEFKWQSANFLWMIIIIVNV